MANGTTIQARIDPHDKEQARGVLNNLGISMSEAISLYIRQIILHKGIPFEIKLPNETTLKTIEASERGEELHTVSDTNELLRELHN